MNKLLIVALGLMSLTLSQLALSQTKPEPRVHIEVVIFQSLALRGWTEEYWPDLIELPETQDAVILGDHSSYAQRLDREYLTLNESVAKMTPEKGYEILAHFAWQQDIPSKNNALRVLIDPSVQQLRQETSVLFGTIRYYQERYAHLELDLELDRVIPERIKQRFAEHQQIDPDWLPESWRFQLNESRRIRHGQLHYFDHPIFGVLVKVETIKAGNEKN